VGKKKNLGKNRRRGISLTNKKRKRDRKVDLLTQERRDQEKKWKKNSIEGAPRIVSEETRTSSDNWGGGLGMPFLRERKLQGIEQN